MVHSKEDLEMAKEASKILFGKATFEALNKFNAKELSEIFEGVPSFEIAKADIENGLDIVEFLADKTGIQNSNGEARRSLKENAISINKTKVKMDTVLTTKDVLDNGFILAQKGKKNYFLVEVR